MALRYISFASLSYLVASLAGIILSLRHVSASVNLTMVEIAPRHLALLGFIGMSLLGSIYYIVPRLLQRPCPAQGIRLHFWLSAVGILLVFCSLVGGGLVQAVKINQATLPFIKVVRSTVPFIGMATLGWLLLLAGQVIFLLNMQWLLKEHSAAFRKSTRDFLTGMAISPEVRP